jgi:NhaA family Na+:H+ antiporter
MLESIEKKLHPWIAYGVLPLFAFANAGVSLAAISWNDLLHPVVMGVSVGLVVGKPIGVILFSVLYSAITRTSMHLSLKEIGVIGLLAGIGFTMSLFIATLSFGATHAALLDEARLGILTGSMIAMILSVVMIQTLPRR